jgi:NTP pyrophosphatase (non-canonical NTP hydrolase)
MADAFTSDQANIAERAFVAARAARAKFGGARQDDMVVEECGELLTAMARRNRGRGERGAVSKEAADVLLVTFGLMNDDAWAELWRKVERLEGMVAGG